ncbi:hypothetical protein AXG93_146s1110 [Marchantia polymorpha subsp. ruderalis]|uniref:RING-type E3 ubiquitin transferase n=1 Tax=Marchantia polymorpha subsp. ruderalis TaxID=1480154 RepID=A0A176W7J9_MARPO|nr:hypothetical protein AXG93_146s1110 [Marchantia polymorpha subsp. ruderalis]
MPPPGYIPPAPVVHASSSSNNNSGGKTAFSPAVVSIIAVLGSAFLVVSYYRIFAKLCTRWQNRRDIFELEGQPTGMDSDANVSPLTTHGLEQSLIKKIPFFVFKTGDAFTADTDCPVCLSEFLDHQELRLLPKCAHAFHVACIDTWLSTHSTCPLCRAPIFPEDQIRQSLHGAFGAEMQTPPGTERMEFTLGDGVRFGPLGHERMSASPTLRGLLNYEDAHSIWIPNTAREGRGVHQELVRARALQILPQPVHAEAVPLGRAVHVLVPDGSAEQGPHFLDGFSPEFLTDRSNVMAVNTRRGWLAYFGSLPVCSNFGLAELRSPSASDEYDDEDIASGFSFLSLFLFPSAAESLCVGPFPLVVIAAEGNSADVRHDLNRELEGSHESGAETNFLKCKKRLRLDHETSFDGSTSIMFVCAETPRRGLYRRPRSKARKLAWLLDSWLVVKLNIRVVVGSIGHRPSVENVP